MTRFTRAKGSKSSNERTPEDSTPWEVMKKQLLQVKKDSEDSKKREEAEKQRIVNYENFLKDHKIQKRKATWCDFPESQISILGNSTKSSGPAEKKKKKKLESETSCELSAVPSSQEVTHNTQQSKNKSKKNKQIANASKTDLDVDSSEIKDTMKIGNEKKKNKHEINDSKDETQQSSHPKNNEHKKNKKNKMLKTVAEDGTQIAEGSQQNINKNKNNGPTKNNNTKQRKKQKFVNGEPVRRKPVNDNSFQFIINGKEIELVRFDGFPIMKKDAERLQELKTSMIKKGIPKSEVQRTLKLERRRAEKALARLKRDVCYNCRKGGHNLSDCPDLKTKIPGVGAPDGICFKCGSTEHRQFECKVQKDSGFRFATCFICKEPGHIARQCPDNPKGLYPNGGSCKLCGDVTHLRKDCPTVQDKREDSSMKLQTLDSTEHIEGITEKTKTTSGEDKIKKPKKITF